ncbi:molecular chaperone DnaJ [cyanobiont of Ornithocercus magnificus]|nr:molecular chaperone DnaJ [cyanobiont of Ornithocercus magnificus]
MNMGSVSDQGSQDPYQQLGLDDTDASFEDVQAARDRCLREVGDDPQARARVESSYDAVLMSRLRDRQMGRVSTAAASASEREQSVPVTTGLTAGANMLLSRLKSLRPYATEPSSSTSFMPTLRLAEGKGLLIRLALGTAGLLLVLLDTGAVELLLSLGTIGLFISQIRRGRRPLVSLGWSALLLAIGLALGGLLLQLISLPTEVLLNPDQIEAIPALLLLLIGTLLLA